MRLRSGSQEDVTDRDRPLIREPVHDLRLSRGRVGLDPAGQLVPGLERIGHLDAAILQAANRAGGGPDVLRRDVARGTRMPGDGQQDVLGPTHLRRRVDRVDQREPGRGLNRERADLLAPLFVPGGPASEPGGDLAEGAHRAPSSHLAWLSEPYDCAVAAGRERERTLKRIREICLHLPETSERLSHGAPTFFVRGKKAFLMVLTNHHGDGRFAIWCAAADGMQRMLVDADPERFFVPPYVGHRGWLGVRLDRGLDWDELAGTAEDAYAEVAPAKLVAAARQTT